MTSRQRPEHRREGETGPVSELHEAFKIGVDLLIEVRRFYECIIDVRPEPTWRPHDVHEEASRLIVAAIGNHRLDDPWPWRSPRATMIERLLQLQHAVLFVLLDGHVRGNLAAEAAGLRVLDVATTLVQEAEWLQTSFESASVDAELCHVDLCQLGNLAVAQRIAAAAGKRFSVRTVEVARMLRDGQGDPEPQQWLDLLDRVAELSEPSRDEAPPAPIQAEPSTPIPDVNAEAVPSPKAKKRRAA